MQTSKTLKWILTAYAALVVIFFQAPIISVFLASLNGSRFFQFPFNEWTTRWFQQAFTAITPQQLLKTSLQIALVVMVISVVIGFAGAMAFARYRWKGRKLFQRFIILPVFFPQAVLGLALLLWFKNWGITAAWYTAVFAHLVWIVPVVILIIAIQVYSFDPGLEAAARDLGAKRLRVFREVTLPLLWPGVRTAAIFAFILSWINFPLSLFTSGSDSTVPVWIYAKMIGGYTPLVPTLGALSILGALLVLVLIIAATLTLRRLQRRRRFSAKAGGAATSG